LAEVAAVKDAGFSETTDDGAASVFDAVAEVGDSLTPKLRGASPRL
jgi:hypothetical protein